MNKRIRYKLFAVTAILGMSILAPASGKASPCLSDTGYTCLTIDDQADNNPPATPTSETFTQLLGINDSGMVVGYYGSGMDANHPNKGFVIPNVFARTPTFTHENPPSATQTQLFGINSSGTVAVGFYQDTAGAQHGLIGLLGASFIGPVDDTPGGVAQPVNQLLGLNGNNTMVAGFYQDSAGIFHAYTLNLIGNPPYTSVGPPNSQATGINNSGEITGFTFTNSTDTDANGFLIDGATTTTLQFPGSTFTQAFGLNNDGEVVGDYMGSDGLLHGFLYYVNDGQFVTLDPAGSTGTTLNGINDQGDIVGFYMDGGTGGDGIANTHGLLATPVPEPASIGLLSLAFGGLCLAYREKRRRAFCVN